MTKPENHLCYNKTFAEKITQFNQPLFLAKKPDTPIIVTLFYYQNMKNNFLHKKNMFFIIQTVKLFLSNITKVLRFVMYQPPSS